MASNQVIDFEHAKKSARSEFDFYEFKIQGDTFIEKIENPSLTIKMVSKVNVEDKKRIMNDLLPSLNVIYSEVINNEKLSRESSRVAKFLDLKKPCKAFYDLESNTFYFKKRYKFEERFCIGISREGDFFYILGTEHSIEAREYYEKVKKMLKVTMKNRNIKVISKQKKIIQDIN